jgi:hypothetical protein
MFEASQMRPLSKRVRLILWKQQLTQGDISQVAAVYWTWGASGIHSTKAAPT